MLFYIQAVLFLHFFASGSLSHNGVIMSHKREAGNNCKRAAKSIKSPVAIGERACDRARSVAKGLPARPANSHATWKKRMQRNG